MNPTTAIISGASLTRWLPIESAPLTQSKTSFLVYTELQNIYAVYRDHDGTYFYFGGWGKLNEDPTHWMPMPKRPVMEGVK